MDRARYFLVVHVLLAYLMLLLVVLGSTFSPWLVIKGTAFSDSLMERRIYLSPLAGLVYESSPTNSSFDIYFVFTLTAMSDE